jgi:phosphatidyl-myo-inositol alpha-mannosyltransferase
MAQLPEKLKVGLVLDGGLEKPDGVQQYILAIGDWLRSQGHDARYLVAGDIKLDVEGAHSLGRNIGVKFNGNRLVVPLPTSRRKLRKFLSGENFDVLHVQTPYSPMMGEQLIQLADKQTAVVGTFHILPNSWLSDWGSRLLAWWSRRSLSRFDAMLSVSSAAASFAKRAYSLDSNVLPNVVDYQRFHKAKPFEHYDDDTLTILFFGRLVPRKGCQLLLQAIAQLDQVPKFRVVICGTGPLRSKLEHYVQAHGLNEKVEFTGFVSEADKPRYYASADIAVFPSSGGESFGIVLLEAMSSGRAAVLAGNNPGYESVMLPQKELLFDPHDAAALADKLQLYMNNATLRQELADWGSQYTQDFDVEVVGQKLLQVYKQALRKRRQL